MNGVPWHRISFGWSWLAKRKLGSPWFSNGAVMKLPVVWVTVLGIKATNSMDDNFFMFFGSKIQSPNFIVVQLYPLDSRHFIWIPYPSK